MLRKYVGETAILIPTDIPRDHKDAYTYSWKYKHVQISTSYHASFVFTHPGVHKFELTVVDKKTSLKSKFIYSVEAMQTKLIPHNINEDYFGLVTIWRGTDFAGQSYQLGWLRIYAPISATLNESYLNIGGMDGDVEQTVCRKWLRDDVNGFLLTGSLSHSRSLNGQKFGCSAPVLLDNRVLIAGNTSEADYGDSTEIYDFVTETWSTSGNMNTPRHKFCFPTLLPDGKVFVFGGCNLSNVFNVGWEIFDPATGIWTAHTPPAGSYLLSGDYGYAAPPLLLADGRLLILHSHENCFSLFNPATSTFTKVSCSVTISREGCTVIQAPVTHEIYFVSNANTTSLCKYNLTTNIWTDLPGWVDIEGLYFTGTLTGACCFVRKNSLVVISSNYVEYYVPETDSYFVFNSAYALAFNIDRNKWDYINGSQWYTDIPEAIYSNAFEIGQGHFKNYFDIWGGRNESDRAGYHIAVTVPYFHAPFDAQVDYVNEIVLSYSFYRDGLGGQYDFTTSLLNGSEVTMTIVPNPYIGYLYDTADNPDYYSGMGKRALEKYVNVSLVFYSGGGG